MIDYIRSTSFKFTPQDSPEMTIYYCHDLDGEVDIVDLSINGAVVSDSLYNIVIDDHRDEWEAEIEKCGREEAKRHEEDRRYYDELERTY